MPGFEPGASYMRSKRSTAELHPHMILGILYVLLLVAQIENVEIFFTFFRIAIITLTIDIQLYKQYMRFCDTGL